MLSVGCFVSFAVSPGTWPGGAWFSGGLRPVLCCCLYTHNPDMAVLILRQNVSHVSLAKWALSQFENHVQIFTSHLLMMNEQDQVTGEVPSSGPSSVSNFNFHSWSCSLAIFGSKATRNITQSNCRCLSLLMFQPVFQLTLTSLPLPLNLQCCCMAEREQPLASTKTFAPRSCRFGSGGRGRSSLRLYALLKALLLPFQPTSQQTEKEIYAFMSGVMKRNDTHNETHSVKRTMKRTV